MLEFQRLLSTEKTPPYDTVAWEKTDIKIIAEDGHIVFSLEGGEFPATWSDNARKIAASKYFKAPRTGNEKPETSVRSMIERVVVTVEKAAPYSRMNFAWSSCIRWLRQIHLFGST